MHLGVKNATENTPSKVAISVCVILCVFEKSLKYLNANHIIQ